MYVVKESGIIKVSPPPRGGYYMYGVNGASQVRKSGGRGAGKVNNKRNETPRENWRSDGGWVRGRAGIPFQKNKNNKREQQKKNGKKRRRV